MPMDAQTRLLRVLQQGEYTTVGGRTPIKTDVRIVAATNQRPPDQLINQGLFREDLLLSGLNVVPLRLPPLCGSGPRICRISSVTFVRHAVGRRARRPSGSTARPWNCSSAYPWPGNVRELENVVPPRHGTLPAGRDHPRNHRQ